MIKLIILSLLNILLLCPVHVLASEADVIDAEVKRGDDGTFTFNVTVQHADEGWHHYATHWLILDKDEKLIAARKLMHPHVNEKSFTRSLPNVEIPDEVTEVIIGALCSTGNSSGKRLTLKIER
jgi:hypothetical protein